MLVLTRKRGEAIRIDGQIVIRIIELSGNRVQLGIDAPGEVPVHRDEVYQRLRDEDQRATPLTID